MIRKRNSPIAIFLLALAALFWPSGQTLAIGFVNADVNGNHSPEIVTTPGGDRWQVTLVPDPARYIGPGATSAELTALQAQYPAPLVNPVTGARSAGWIFMNGGTLGGILRVEQYDAYADDSAAHHTPVDTLPLCFNPIGTGRPATPFGAVAAPQSDCLKIVYTSPFQNGVNPVGPNKLRWVQLICTNSPVLAKAGSFCPPAAGTYVDPQGPTLPLPFYYTEAEHAASSVAGNPPLEFYDRTHRGFPALFGDLTWRAHLYLVEWNGIMPDPATPGPDGIVIIHDGVEWGFGMSCLAHGQPAGTWTGGGVDSDKPASEQNGVEPPGPPSTACARPIGPVIPLPSTQPTPQCPPDQILGANGLCTFPACPQGETRNADGVCVLPACPPGEVRGANGQCQLPPCPQGETRNAAGACVFPPCPQGQVRGANGQCQLPSCPAGEVRGANGLCQLPPCPQGETQNAAGACVFPPCPQGQVRGANGQCQLPSCPAGEVRGTNGLCQLPPCPPGEVRGANGQCQLPPCPPGEVRGANGECAFPACPQGEVRNADGVCIFAQCPQGQVRGTNGQCQLPACPLGQVRANNGQCVPRIGLLPLPEFGAPRSARSGGS